MSDWIKVVITAVASVVASSGFWAILGKRIDTKDARTKLLIGLAHDRIVTLGMQYIERGYITKNEYEDLSHYLYEPYTELGGNGSAKRVMTEVQRLPIRADFQKQEVRTNYGVAE